MSEYDELRSILKRSSPNDVVAALLEVWDQQKLAYLVEELESEFEETERADERSEGRDSTLS